jgi:hypothetical protein
MDKSNMVDLTDSKKNLPHGDTSSCNVTNNANNTDNAEKRLSRKRLSESSKEKRLSESSRNVNLNLDEESKSTCVDPSKEKKQKKIKDKSKIVIVTTPQLKSLLKIGDSKSNRVSKEISPKINQYFIEIILPEFLDTVEYKDEKLFFTESEMSENKFLPSTKFNTLAFDFFNKKYPDFKIKFNKEKENFLKFQRICEFRLLNLIQCAQLLKEHCNRQTLHISDWYLAIKR